jgi:two-component system sensor histidine kinase VanS
LFFFSAHILSRFTWHGDELLYPILHSIAGNARAFLAFCWACGFIIIPLIYWRKTLGYVDTIAKASSMLVASNEDLVLGIAITEMWLISERIHGIVSPNRRDI